MTKNFKTSLRSRILLLLFVSPAIVLFALLGVDIALTANVLAGIAFVIAGLLLALWLVFQLTFRLEIDASSIVRSWVFGGTVVPMGEISRLVWGGSRGQCILTIRFKKSWIQLSSLTLTRDELHEIQQDILAYRGLEGQPLWPPMAPYVDIDKMIERNGNRLEA